MIWVPESTWRPGWGPTSGQIGDSRPLNPTKASLTLSIYIHCPEKNCVKPSINQKIAKFHTIILRKGTAIVLKQEASLDIFRTESEFGALGHRSGRR